MRTKAIHSIDVGRQTDRILTVTERAQVLANLKRQARQDPVAAAALLMLDATPPMLGKSFQVRG